MRTFLAAVLAVLLNASLACAPTWAQAQDGNGSKPDIHVSNYGRLNPSCQQWSDGCRTCTQAGCSNIGLACQPQEVKCLVPTSPPDKGQ
jgi:hypothetical protein